MLYNTENAQAVHITLEPGEALKKHKTPVDVFFYVLEGKGVVEIGGEKQEVGQDTLINSPAKIPHCWYNESDAVLRFLVVKVPRPTESTKLL
ncbi:MAG: cupin domain-containing protein [Desulfatitalea sp.]|nr:cupin domain-containing protein [Desulfatitalea sp.]